MKKLFDQMKRKCGIALTREYIETEKYLVVSSWNWYSDYDRHFYDAKEFDSLEAAQKYIEDEIPKIRQNSMHIFKKLP